MALTIRLPNPACRQAGRVLWLVDVFSEGPRRGGGDAGGKVKQNIHQHKRINKILDK